jgi:Response regulator containing a CheY-like receiver domain and an HTH DNA-binding domain
MEQQFVIRVGIVDDHPVVLGGLAASLAQQAEIDVAWSASNLEDAREALRSEPCDVVLVDVRLPDGSGLDLISRGAGAPAFVVLSSFDRPQYARATYQRGGAGYLLKTAPMEEIVSALRIAAAGGTSFRARHLASIAAGPSLTPRELDIVRLVAQGWSNDEVATRLSLSAKTVEAYLTRLFERWNVGTRTELALQAEREGWLEADGR